nr:helix-turn-helix domain-containing protein [Streptomyces sp. NBC_00899]WSX82242.1 helix-turn-helix domain-containing protein [Streptomyces sp. NBC_00899]
MAELPADPLAELARQLRTLKAQRGLQTGGLQQRTGLGRTTLSQALSGHRAPSETTLVLLAKALGADPEPLLALRSAAARPPRVQGVASCRTAFVRAAVPRVRGAAAFPADCRGTGSQPPGACSLAAGRGVPEPGAGRKN